MTAHNKGQSSTAENAGRSAAMRWVRDVALPYSGDDCLIFPFRREPTGYAGTVRRGKKMYYHRYICELVHGAPPTPKHHAAHSCDNGPGGCVNPNHLSWKTNAENQTDRFRDGQRTGRYKLLTHQAEEIRALRGLEHVAVTAARFGISVSHTKNIQTGRAAIPGNGSVKLLTAEQVNGIRQIAGTMSDREVGLRYGVKAGTVYNIRRGVYYSHVPATHTSGERT